MTKIILIGFSLATAFTLYTTYTGTMLEDIKQESVRTSHASSGGYYSSGGSWGYGK